MAAIRRLKKNSISKLDLINKLEKMNIFNETLSVLKSNEFTYEKWSAASEFILDNKNDKVFLESLGLDLNSLHTN